MSAWYQDINDLKAADKAINGGFWAAIFVTVVTSIVVALSFAGINMFKIGPSALIDAAIFAAIAVGIKRRSRFAAVAGLVLYIIERIYMFQHNGNTGGIIMGIAFTLLFLNAVRGTYAYHRMTEGQARPMPSNANA